MSMLNVDLGATKLSLKQHPFLIEKQKKGIETPKGPKSARNPLEDI
jgi:hypothetical protein